MNEDEIYEVLKRNKDEIDEIYEVLKSFKAAIDYLSDKIDSVDKMYHDNNEQTDERIEALEDALFNQILDPTMKALEEKKYNEFHDKYGEKLDAYNDKLRALEGEDFDLSREAYKGWNEYEAPEGYEPYEEGEYVDALVGSVEEQLKELRDKLGIPEDAKVEAVSLPDGETVVSVDDKPIEETVEVKEEPKEEPAPVEEGKMTPEEEAELEEELKRYKRR